MKKRTKYHGEIELKKENILHFQKGIPGFEEETKFTLLPLSDDGVFSVLQSLQTSELAFVVTNPFHFYQEYDFTLEDYVIEFLQIKTEADVLVYSILTVQEPFEHTTANLQAPIIINKNNNLAQQVILNNTTYKTKHAIFQTSKPLTVKG